MDDRPDDSRKTPRQRAVLPPFVAPRAPTPQAGSPTAPAVPSESARRRAAHLFTPPGMALSSRRTPAAMDGSPESSDTASSELENVADDVAEGIDEDALVVERLDAREIHLTVTGEQRSVGEAPDIQVIAYEEANNQLRSSTPEGIDPEVDGLRFEATELSLEIPSANRLEVESFWAADPFHGSVPAAPHEPTSSSNPSPFPATDAAQVVASGGADARALEEFDASNEARDSAVDDEEAFAWAGELDATSSYDAHVARGDVAERLAQESVEQLDAGTPAASALEELKEAEPWPSATTGPARRDARELVGDALERVARRIRAGEVELSADAASSASDESALAAALAALLRSR